MLHTGRTYCIPGAEVGGATLDHTLRSACARLRLARADLQGKDTGLPRMVTGPLRRATMEEGSNRSHMEGRLPGAKGL